MYAMTRRNEEMNEFLEQAKGEYRASIPDKLEELERYLRLLERNSDQHDIHRRVFDIVHRISGSAGSFALDDIGNVADEWERKLREPNPDYAAMFKYIASIRRLL